MYANQEHAEIIRKMTEEFDEVQYHWWDFTEFILQEFKIWSATNLGKNFRGTSLLPHRKKGGILLKSPFGMIIYTQNHLLILQKFCFNN